MVHLLLQEKQRLKEIQAQKEAEEAAAREQIRREEEEYNRRKRAEEERRRQELDREIRVSEERKRLDAIAQQQQMQNQNSYYQQYENLPPQGSPKHLPEARFGPTPYAPSPPSRGSSYMPVTRSVNQGHVDGGERLNDGYRGNNPNVLSPFRSSQENIPKKTVSFNPHVNSQLNSEPPVSTSYQPFQRSYTSPEQNYSRTNFSSPSVPVNSVNVNNNNNNDKNNVVYKTEGNTPTVIGSQEIYRDPRSRIEAKMANKGKQNADRLSFRDKMKFFAQEAGENTPKEKARASTTQRRIESQILHNGQ